MSWKHKIIAGILLIIVIASACYLLINYELIKIIEPPALMEDNRLNITDNIPYTLEKYKIINIQYINDKIYAIVALSNGNIHIIEFNEAYIDPNLKNINEGYLYRDPIQIYIKAE